MSAYILPALIILTLIYAAVKKIPIYDCFAEGAKEAASIVFSILPYIIAIYIGLELFKESGLGKALAGLLEPALTFIGVPYELTELIIIRPLSGSGSLALLNEIYAAYGPDSFPARCASVIIGSTETVFYVAAVYCSRTKSKSLRLAIPIALFSSFAGAVLSCWLCRIM